MTRPTLSLNSPRSASFSLLAALFTTVFAGAAQPSRAAVDLSFDPGSSLGSGSFNSAHIALQADGKLIAAGDFDVKVAPFARGLARFNADGAFDDSYKVPGGGVSGTPEAILVLPDGKSLLATHPASGKPPGFINDPHGIVRVGAGGVQDTSFRPTFPGESDPGGASSSPVGEVNAVVRLPDGKLLIGGSVGRLTTAGTTYYSLLRLSADGAPDSTFGRDDNTALTRYVYAILVQPDGKILLAGHGSGQKGGPIVSRVNADGTPDASFTPPADPLTDANGRCVALQPDGKVIVGGRFRTTNPLANDPLNRFCLVRLNPDGSTDGSFVPPVFDFFTAVIYKIIVLPDGKILIAGNLSGVNSDPVNGVRVLNPDGSVDASSPYNVDTNGFVSDVILQDNGGMLISGGFTEAAGVRRNLIARIGSGVGPAPKVADLTVSTSSVKAKVKANGKVIFSGALTITNSGNKAAKKVFAGVYLSDDGVFNADEDHLVGQVSLAEAGFNKVGKGKTVGPIAFRFKVKTAQVGEVSGKYLVVVADPQGAIEESDENNNTAATLLPSE